MRAGLITLGIIMGIAGFLGIKWGMPVELGMGYTIGGTLTAGISALVIKGKR